MDEFVLESMSSEDEAESKPVASNDLKIEQKDNKSKKELDLNKNNKMILVKVNEQGCDNT